VNDTIAQTLAKARLRKVTVLSVAHGIAADQAERRNKWLGVPVVILASIVGTSVFASLTDLGKSQIPVAIVTGLLSVLAAVLAAIQTLFNFAGSAQAHARATIRFQTIGNAIEHLLVEGSGTIRQQLQQVDEEVTKAQEESPRVSQRLQQVAAGRLPPDSYLSPGDRSMVANA
jgi:hypothetical protein